MSEENDESGVPFPALDGTDVSPVQAGIVRQRVPGLTCRSRSFLRLLPSSSIRALSSSLVGTVRHCLVHSR